MIMVFIIPVKSALITSNWEKFSQLFERCLRSVCQQTDQDFKVVVVCNEKPDVNYHHPAVHYHYVDFPPPTHEMETQFKGLQSAKEADKSKKILAGIEYAARFNKSHAMVVDSDDCINNKTVAFVNKHPGEDGWYSKSGFVYRDGSTLIFKKLSDFNSLCGSSVISKIDLLKQFISPDLYYNHPYTKLESGRIRFKPLPFPVAVYTINGENYFMSSNAVKHLSGKSYSNGLMNFTKKLSRYRVWFLTNQIRRNFGLYQIAST